MVVGSNRWPLVAVSGGHRDSSYKGYSIHPHSTKPTFIHPFNPPPPLQSDGLADRVVASKKRSDELRSETLSIYHKLEQGE